MRFSLRCLCAYSLKENALMPAPIIPGVLLAMQMLYGINFNAVRPVDVVASIAPRPLFFIEGTSDGLVPPWNRICLQLQLDQRQMRMYKPR